MTKKLDPPKNISKLYKEISSILRTARANSSAMSDELTSIIPIPSEKYSIQQLKIQNVGNAIAENLVIT